MDSQLLLNNVEIFNGKDARTFSGNLLIRNNRIETISAAPIETPSERPVTVIDGTPLPVDAELTASINRYLLSPRD